MIAAPELLTRIDSLTTTELAWLSGYCWARVQPNAVLPEGVAPVNAPQVEVAARKVVVLSASQTGNSKRVAAQLHQQLQGLNVQLEVHSLGDYKSKNLGQEDVVLLISSTQGEGEFPEEALSFAKFLFSSRAPKLSQVSFAVLALGDSSYPLFCEAGKQFDQRLAELGARRLTERVDCDLAYEDQAEHWCAQLHNILDAEFAAAQQASAAPANTALVSPSSTASYSKDAPYTAQLITRQKITARSANKDVVHLEIDLGDSGIEYQAGDSLGVYVNNSASLVTDFLQALNLDAQAPVQLPKLGELSLEQALTQHLELTQNNAVLIKKWAVMAENTTLLELTQAAEQLAVYAQHTPLLALVREFPASISAQDFVDFLRPLTPRMYSIASAQEEVGAEVHLTLGLVNYQHQEQEYYGAASYYLGKHLEEDANLSIFVEPNNRFRLPENPSTPIIMIGAGTGIAPFRAFMQQRENADAAGPAWLIFGNQKFTDDFLYQSEWQRWHQLGLLPETSLAWSRANPNQKVYVQHKVIEASAKIWQWLQEGAHIYVCGDANQMAKAVETALLEVIQQAGNLDAASAADYLDQLRDDRRYQRDVY